MSALEPTPYPEGNLNLGIDPGNFDTAYCVLSDNRQIGVFGKIPNDQFREVLRFLLPRMSRIGIEMIASFGLVAGASLFETSHEIGRLQEIIETAGYGSRLQLITRNEVKKNICPGIRSNDSIIRAALIKKFGPQGKKSAPGPTYGVSNDVWSALAIAETTRSGNFAPYIFSHLRVKKPKLKKPKLKKAA